MGYLIAEISPLVGYLFTLLDYIAHLWAQKGQYSYDSFQKYSPFVVSLWSLNGRIFFIRKDPVYEGLKWTAVSDLWNHSVPCGEWDIEKGAISHEGDKGVSGTTRSDRPFMRNDGR